MTSGSKQEAAGAGTVSAERPSSAAVDVSISIVNRNGRDMTLDCIASIFESTRETSLEIVVVDNASTDDSIAAIRQRFPDAVFVEHKTPRGYGASHNAAFRVSRGQYFLAMNNDMIVRSGAIDALHRRIRADDGIGVLGCRLLNRDGSMQRSCAPESSLLRVVANDLLPSRFPLARVGLDEWHSNWAHDTDRDVHVLQGSCLMLPRQVMEAVEGFDERFDFYREEFDLCRRVRMAGYRVSFTPVGEIVHFGNQTSRSMTDMATRIYFESRYKYFEKHHGRAAALAATASGIAHVLTRWAGYELLRLLPGSKRGKRTEAARLNRSLLPWFFGADRPWRRGGTPRPVNQSDTA